MLTIDPAGTGISVGGPYAAGVPVDGSNLVARALQLAGRPAAVHIDKRIPHGGGLGGGSADAAAVLRWAGFDDLAAASRLGADVPFCMVGGRARVRGIGEIVEPTPFQPLDVTLVVPPLHVSTPAVYRAWDDLGGPTADGPNDLEPAALAVEPELARWRDRIAARCGVHARARRQRGDVVRAGQGDDALASLRGEGVAVVVARTTLRADRRYLRRWWRVRRSIFLCFFLRMRLRRFLINEPIRPFAPSETRRSRTARAGYRSAAPRDTVRPSTLADPSGVVQSVGHLILVQ